MPKTRKQPKPATPTYEQQLRELAVDLPRRLLEICYGKDKLLTQAQVDEALYYLANDVHYWLMGDGRNGDPVNQLDIDKGVNILWNTLFPDDNLEYGSMKSILVFAAVWAGFDLAVRTIGERLKLCEWKQLRETFE